MIIISNVHWKMKAKRKDSKVRSQTQMRFNGTTAPNGYAMYHNLIHSIREMCNICWSSFMTNLKKKKCPKKRQKKWQKKSDKQKTFCQKTRQNRYEHGIKQVTKKSDKKKWQKKVTKKSDKKRTNKSIKKSQIQSPRC